MDTFLCTKHTNNAPRSHYLRAEVSKRVDWFRRVDTHAPASNGCHDSLLRPFVLREGCRLSNRSLTPLYRLSIHPPLLYVKRGQRPLARAKKETASTLSKPPPGATNTHTHTHTHNTQSPLFCPSYVRNITYTQSTKHLDLFFCLLLLGTERAVVIARANSSARKYLPTRPPRRTSPRLPLRYTPDPVCSPGSPHQENSTQPVYDENQLRPTFHHPNILLEGRMFVPAPSAGQPQHSAAASNHQQHRRPRGPSRDQDARKTLRQNNGAFLFTCREPGHAFFF